MGKLTATPQAIERVPGAVGTLIDGAAASVADDAITGYWVLRAAGAGERHGCNFALPLVGELGVLEVLLLDPASEPLDEPNVALLRGGEVMGVSRGNPRALPTLLAHRQK